MAATITIYPPFLDSLRFVGSSTLKVALLASGYTYSSAHDAYADLTNELSTANGYTNGGATLSSVTWSRSSGVLTLDAADVTWTASGGSIVARYAVIYVDATINSVVKPLVAYILLDDSPADVTRTDGQDFVLQFNASGIATVTIS
jgi:hypothetical protein